jgi:ABC-type phosphate/phosphonate transport system substrate-binding protein
MFPSPTPAVEVASIRIAALPMYDFPELREAHDRLWAALAQRLQALGVSPVPRRLTRGLSHREVWAHPGLLFGQACEYPLSRFFRERLRVVATPRYGAPGCADTDYRSAIVVRADEPAEHLEDLRNRRGIANEADSNSGMNLFRAALARFSSGTRFFHSMRFSGSHQRSMELVATGEADVTAIDCVTLAYLQRLQPHLTLRLRVIDWTPTSPCLPFVTSQQTSESTLQALRSALAEVFADRALAPVRDTLLLEGVDLSPDPTFARVKELELEAEGWHYPVLL